ncbi:ATP-binding protein [Streptomyces sp. NPDC059850]|uniref:ATP-binding protein n=1 Tax=Streptomyces sp. NPDC059850 TaxID=3346970 RepID=UPI00364FA463
MFEIVTVSALTAFLAAVGNGAAGEVGKQVLVSTGALVRRTLGREAPLPSTPEGWELLARQMQPRLAEDPRYGDEFARLVRSLPEVAALRPGVGLPPATRDFTDRQAVLKQLRREATRAAAGRPRVALLYGPPGIGTSAVALHWGADRIARYPDGQFYVDARDTAADNGLEPAAVLERLLRQMGLEPGLMPPTEVGREETYRRLTAGRRALVVIDHASSVAQVRGLIPATPEVFLLVVASGPAFLLEAERIAVPPLKDRDAVELLRKVAGPEPVARAKPHMPALLDGCAGNAFALKAAAVRLLTGEQPLADVTDPHPVRGMAQDACRRLRPEAARLCRLTALGGWPAFDARLAGEAAGVAREDAARMLTEAADVQLLEPVGDGRYRFRPEVRRYLADAAGPEHGIAECAAAVSRVLDGLLHQALHAARAALSQSWRTECVLDGASPYANESEGMTALLAEAGNLVRAVSVAEEYGHIDTALWLARALWPLQLKAGYWDDTLPALRIAARCADEHHPGTRLAGALHFQLGHCLGELRQWEQAEGAVRAAVSCERAAGHVRGEASSVEMLGLLCLYQWRWDEAYERFGEAERVYGRIGPGEEGARDLPRALALIQRHQGRALRGAGELTESVNRLEVARDFFAEQGEAYNLARTLTDLAETLHDAGDDAAALTKITEAERLLAPERAAPHLAYLAGLRERCGA